VIFLLPEHGPGGTFADGSHSLTVTTDAQGRAAAHGIHLNNVQGQFQIGVNATYNGMTATATISQSIAVGAAGGAGAGVAAGLSAKAIVIIVVAAAAAAGGAAYAATHTGGSSSTTVSGTTITPGTGTVGPPTIIIGLR
jgi:hypothetical protein